MKRQPTEMKSNIKKKTEFTVLLDVITIKEENIAIMEKRNKKKSSELSSTCMVYQILNFLLKLTPIYLHFLKVFPCCNKVLL